MTTQTKTTWQRMKFKDFADTSPSVKLERGKEYPFIPMDVVNGQYKFPLEVRHKSFSGGGSKFANGDTIFARITPCLENGKIAKIKELKQGVGFGSTEFFVFRGKDGVSDSDFVYYLSRTDSVRGPAIKSMVGASGRQRADKTVVDNVQVLAPSLSQQKQIADVLSTYDDLIENNTKRIKILEQIAQAIYKEWFVKPVNSGELPCGWEMSTLSEYLSGLESGSRPKGGVGEIKEGVPSVGAENINGIGRHDHNSEKYITKEFFEKMKRGVVQDRDVALYKDGAYIGRSSYFRDDFPHKNFSVNEHVFLLRSSGERITQNFLYLWLREPDTIHEIRATNANAAQPGINQPGIRGLKIILPPQKMVETFDAKVEPMLASIINLAKQNNELRQARDLLLPKLVGGEIKVKQL